ncbi:MAG TPA: Crp/Fnr family transcriptional regulator [Steroidobacteraceae bacterium]
MRRNRILADLPLATLRRLAPEIQLRQMQLREQVARRGQPIADIYFPLTCVLSTVAEGAAGEVVEVATLGNEGMSGLSVFLGTNGSSTLETYTQVIGESLWMGSRPFKALLRSEQSLSQTMGRYTEALLTQISQASACNRLHTVQERCARWLLMSHDRVLRDEFELTQEFLAQMLGVRRASVGAVASGLQRAGVISYVRGNVIIKDREGLEQRSCECYSIIRDEYTRLFPPLNRRRYA